METRPGISVVIPTLNEEEHIGPLLKQLSAYPELELIITDGGSRDHTLELCQAFPVRVVQTAPGRGAQLNAGARLASAAIVFFLHADSGIEAQVFNDIRQAISQGYDWGCCQLRFDRSTGFYRMVAGNSNRRARYFSTCFGDQGIFCRREFFERVGGFPEIPFLEDMVFSQHARKYSRARIVPARITTSSRRFVRGGPWRTLFKMQLIQLLFRLGVKPERLIVLYK